MNKYIFCIAAAVLSLGGFTACEDVPAPYGINTTPTTPDTPSEAKGDGTIDNPYNPLAAINYCKSLGSDVNSENDVYIKGKVVSVEEAYNTTFGNGSFTISEDGKSTNTFKIWRALYIDNKKYVEGQTQVKVGDEIVVCGKVVNFKGNTPETVQGQAYLVSINGNGGGSQGGGEATATGDGTKANPYNSVAANTYVASLAADVNSDKDVYIKGKIASIEEAYNTTYGNGSFTISDDGTSNNAFKVWRALYLNNEKYTEGKTQIQIGDEVVVCGKVVNFKGNTPETAQGLAYLVSLTSKGGESTGGETGGEVATDAKTVVEAQSITDGSKIFVTGYVIGYIDGKVFSTGIQFTAPDASVTQTNIVIADSPTETDPNKCYPIQLPTGALRTGLSLAVHPTYIGQKITIYGQATKYFGVAGLKSPTYAEIAGVSLGTKP